MQLFLEYLPGIIWAAALGLALGNYACSAAFRLPKAEPLFVRKPFCSTCETPLQRADLVPFFSFLWLKGKCRTCHAPIPVVYSLIELSAAGIMVAGYLQSGFSEQMILTAALGLCLVMLVASEHLYAVLWKPFLYSAMALALLLRVLLDGTFYNALFGGFIMVLLAAAWSHVRKKPFDATLWLWAILGAALGDPRCIFYACAITFVLQIIQKIFLKNLISFPYCFSVILILLTKT